MPKRHWSAYVKARPKRRGKMNRTEAAYAERLTALQLAGKVMAWYYEGLTFRLTTGHPSRPAVRYTPDFFVVLPDGQTEIHETKGYETRDGSKNLKLLADRFPFRCLLVKRAKREPEGWTWEEF